jgi:hypothetical protein
VTPINPAAHALTVLTWHVHGNYLWYLSNVPVTWVLPVAPGRTACQGRGTSFPFPPNVVEVDVRDLPAIDVDVVLYQSGRQWESDRLVMLSERQRRAPAIYLEHDPPLASPTNTRHAIDTPEALVVHVTAYNRLMWDNGTAPTVVLEHGVAVPDDVHASYDLDRAVTVVNNLATRGRRLGADLVSSVRERVPLDVIGMASEDVGGLGEVPPPLLPSTMARYRCFFHPARYTSLGLAVLEAMACGVPVVGLPTTELPAVIAGGRGGSLATDVEGLVASIRRFIDDPDEARRVGAEARSIARTRFGIERFSADWLAVLKHVAEHGPSHVERRVA